MKKILSAFVSICILMLSYMVSFSYSAEDAYRELAGQYPDFVQALYGQDITEAVMIDFLYDIQDYLKEKNAAMKITEDNFEKNAMEAINVVSAREKYLPIQDALIELYPNAVKQAVLYSKIADEFVPLVSTIKSIVFRYGMLEDGNNTSGGGGSGGSGGSGESDGGKYTVMYITPLTETVQKGSSYNLPEKLMAVTKKGGTIEVSVAWDGKINVSKEGTFTVHGVVTLPRDYSFANGVSNGIDYTVIVSEGLKFTDMPQSHWAYKSVTELAKKMILNGYLDGAFRPDLNITRGEFAKIIVSAADIFDYAAAADFSDVPGDSWYYPYIASAYEKGYITGYPDGSFKPDENITRADICTIVYRSLGEALEEGAETVFEDNAQIPEYALHAVYSLNKMGIINGIGDNLFAPLNMATRAQTAQIIYKAFFENLLKKVNR